MSIEKLRQHKQKEEVPGIFNGKLSQRITKPKIAFLFTDENVEILNMGQQLYETQPTFRQALDQCGHILGSYLENPLLEVLYPQQPQKSSSYLEDKSTYT